MHPSNETPAAVARFQEILEGEFAFREFDFQGALRGLPERNQDIQLQIFAALHRWRLVNQRSEIARGRRGKASLVRLRRFCAEISDEAYGEITPPCERRWQAGSGLASAELQKAVPGTSREARLEPFTEPVLQRKFVFGLIEAQRAMRRQHRNERARHIPKSIIL